MEHSESIAKLAAALVAVQSSIKPMKRTAENPYFHSRYVTLDGVWDACRDALGKNGLAVIQTPSAADHGSIGLTTMLVHTSGEWIRDTAVYPLAKPDPQAAGSAITYARRYGLSAILGMVSEDDDDGNRASGNKSNNKPQHNTDQLPF